jgi:hypothetical protein
MKELNELTERMDGIDELMDSFVKKVTELDKREIKTTDYTPHFEALKQIFEVFLLKYNKESEALKTVVGQLNISYPAGQIQNTLAESKGILEAIRKALPIKVKHQFDFKTKGWIIAGMILLIATAISTGLCGHLWAENNHLQAVGIKYRLLRQVDTSSTKWADSIYTSNPDGAEKTVIRMENGRLLETKTIKTARKPAVKKLSKRRVKP